MKKKQTSPKIEYTFAPMPGGILSAGEVQKAARELIRIEKTFGAIKPTDVVRESKPPTAPLHDHFTWDDKVAAASYREDEARQIIRSVRIIRSDMPPAEQPVMRAIVHVQSHDTETAFEGPAYISIGRAKDDNAYKEQLLTAAKSELQSWERRYADLLQFLGAEQALQTLMAGLEAK